MRIAFRLDVSQNIGLGHYSRCLSLAEAVLASGHEAVFIVRLLPKNLIETLIARGIGVFQLDGISPDSVDWGKHTHLEAQGRNDGVETLNAAKASCVNLLVIDSYHFDDDSFPDHYEKEFRILQIADFPAIQGIDMILDYGFDASWVKHAKSKVPPDQMLLGPTYAPIRASFLNPHRDERGTISPLQHRALLALGSAFPKTLVAELIESYSAHKKGYSLALVTQLETSAIPESDHVQLIKDSDGLSNQMSESSFVVTSGGVTLFERLAMGLPGIAIETAFNQHFSLDKIREKKITEIIRLSELSGGRKLLSLIDAAVKRGFREEDKLRMQQHVDFFGPLRLVFRLGLLDPACELEGRFADESDLPVLLRWANDEGVRRNSFSTATIDEHSHIKWFNALNGQGSKLIVFSKHKIPFGQVRFDKFRGGYLLDYSIDPLFRGLGQASEMLRKAAEIAGIKTDIWAFVKSTNLASKKSLARSGFLLSADDGFKITMKLEKGFGR